MNIGAGNSEGFTAGAIAFLVLNAFLMILGKCQYHTWLTVVECLGPDHCSHLWALCGGNAQEREPQLSLSHQLGKS